MTKPKPKRSKDYYATKIQAVVRKNIAKQIVAKKKARKNRPIPKGPRPTAPQLSQHTRVTFAHAAKFLRSPEFKNIVKGNPKSNRGYTRSERAEFHKAAKSRFGDAAGYRSYFEKKSPYEPR